jgi:tagatose-6-phosphate ketose/aldose isomerase
MTAEYPASFGMTAVALQQAGARWTAAEILQQPQVWPQIAADVAAGSGALAAFLAPLLRLDDLRIVLSGAGTSAYVGECLAAALSRALNRRVEAIATTELVASPANWLSADTPTLLVSFARSGNSPESVAAVELVQGCVRHCAHLVVTCNAQGSLCRQARALTNAHVILLPEVTNDRSFAMTSSFTGMLLAAASAFGLVSVPAAQGLAARTAALLPQAQPLLAGLVRAGFQRVVYLGSGALKGLAHEAALKMLELTDGRVVAAADSALGFRHGPKTILDSRTLVVMFLCNDAHARRYDLDLLSELRRDAVAGRVMVISDAKFSGPQVVDLQVPAQRPAEALSDLLLCLAYAPFAQSLAMLYSLSLGLSPDTPNAAGTVSRVVQGVTIYPWHAEP